MKYFFLLFIFFVQVCNAQSQLNNRSTSDTISVDSGTKDSLIIFKPTINDYQWFTQKSNRKVLDTVLSYEKTYVFSQFNNTDNFGKIQFENTGSGFNPFLYSTSLNEGFSLVPQNKSFGLIGMENVKYYDVKTPTAIFVYHNAKNNGANLNSTYTQNIGKTFNFSIEYLGLRSLGNYNKSLVLNQNVIISGHYKSRNSKYDAFAHFVHQNINNEENGGIANDSLYISGAEAYDNRFNVETNLNTASSRFSYRRYFLSHQFSLFNPEKYPFKLRHTIFHQSNKYYFSQEQLEPYYYNSNSDLVYNFPLSSGKYSENLSNTVSFLFDNPKFYLDAGFRHQLIKTGVYEGLNINGYTIPEMIRENRVGVVGNLKINLWNKISLDSNLEISRGEQFGNYLKTINFLRFEPIKNYFVDANVNFHSGFPNFNYLFNTSIYKDFNYYSPNLRNQNLLELGGSMNLRWFNSKLFANYCMIDNFTYFNSLAQPSQASSMVNISQFGGEAIFNYKKFFLNTKVLVQNTLTNKDLFPAPNFVGRTNLYYQTKAFKKAAEIQAGIKTYYFSKFNSRNYFPVLNEFILRDGKPFGIGGEPIVDLYLNMKVKKMFIFIEGQHMTTLFKNNTSYAAPHYPYQDFRMNIGIVWYMLN